MRTALVMIVRNEARCLQRCLDSVRPWVDEMWVLDTGSLDTTPEIARASGAGVAHFSWCDNFATARNAALALTDVDWCVVLDADEWISEGAECLSALRHQNPSFLGQIRVASLIQLDGSSGETAAPSWLTRVLPRGVRYQGRVHEQPASSLPRRRLPLIALHDGYRPENMLQKQGRNQRLLCMELADAPCDAYLNYQMGKDHEVRGEHALAHPFYALALQRCDIQAGWRHDLVLRNLFTLKKRAEFSAALDFAQAEMPNWPASPDFFFTLGDVLLDWAVAEPARVDELLPMVEASWLQAYEIGEQPQLQDSVVGRGSHLAAHNLAVLYGGLAIDDKALYWRERSLSPQPTPD